MCARVRALCVCVCVYFTFAFWSGRQAKKCRCFRSFPFCVLFGDNLIFGAHTPPPSYTRGIHNRECVKRETILIFVFFLFVVVLRVGDNAARRAGRRGEGG